MTEATWVHWASVDARDDRHGNRLCAEAESECELPFDVMELRVHHLEPDAAPGDLTDGNRFAAPEEGHSIAEHRADAVDAPRQGNVVLRPRNRISNEPNGD